MFLLKTGLNQWCQRCYVICIVLVLSLLLTIVPITGFTLKYDITSIFPQRSLQRRKNRHVVSLVPRFARRLSDIILSRAPSLIPHVKDNMCMLRHIDALFSIQRSLLTSLSAPFSFLFILTSGRSPLVEVMDRSFDIGILINPVFVNGIFIYSHKWHGQPQVAWILVAGF